MNVNLDSFRAMTQGKYNLGSVVVSTDGATHEQQLHKVENHRHFSSRNVAPLPEENVKTRQVLSNLMKARLQQIAGADIASNAELRAEVAKLDTILLGDNIREKLERKGALVEAFKAFDSIESRLLKTRAVTDELRVANAARTALGAVAVKKDKVEAAKEVANPDGQPAEKKPAEKSEPKSVLFFDGMSSEPFVVVEEEGKDLDEDNCESAKQALETRLEKGRSREAVETKLKAEWETHPERMPGASTAGKAVDSAKKLSAEDKAIVDILTQNLNVEQMRMKFAKNPVAAHAILAEIFGALRYLGKVQDHAASSGEALQPKTVSFKVYVDNQKLPTTTMELTLGADGRLELGLHGHRFELCQTIKEFGELFKQASVVSGMSRTYFSQFDADNHTRDHEEANDFFPTWNGNEINQDKESGAVKMLPPSDQRKAVGKIEGMLEKLREVNNQDPIYWGGSPHFSFEMPQLDPVRHARFGRRTEAHIRTYCNQQIERGGWHAVFGRSLAKIQGVSLESGTHCGIQDTLFERAALFLNKVRILALNSNWIFTQFENRPGETDHDAIERICDMVSDLCQLQLHPSDKGIQHSKCDLQAEIRTLIQATVTGYEIAESKGDLKSFFTTLTAGACFQGCTTEVTDYCQQNGNPVDLVGEYTPEFKSRVAEKLESEQNSLKEDIARLEEETAGSPEDNPLLETLKNLRLRLESLQAREIGKGGVFMRDGEVVVSLLPAKEVFKSVKPAAPANALAQTLEWAATPPFAGALIPTLVSEIVLEAKVEGKGHGGAFHILSADDVAASIVEKLKQMEAEANAKGPVDKKPTLDKDLAEFIRERDSLREIPFGGLETYHGVADRKRELLAEYALVEKWRAEGRAAQKNNDRAKINELMDRPESQLNQKWQSKGANTAELNAINAQLQPLENGLKSLLKRSGLGRDAKQAIQGLLTAIRNGEPVDQIPKAVVQELNHRVAYFEAKIAEFQRRIEEVGHVEINLAEILDEDEYGNQKTDFIYFPATTGDQGKDDEALEAFKARIKDVLKDFGYVYEKKDGEPDLWVVGEETLLLNEAGLTMAKGEGFTAGKWVRELHGEEFIKGVTQYGDEVYRSSEGVEIVSPVLGRDTSRRNLDGEDYCYQTGDIILLNNGV